MIIGKICIHNYKIFKDITIPLNDDTNIFVGDNDSGKTTILEAISIVMSGKINGVNISSRFSLDWFNHDVRKEYIEKISKGLSPAPPEIYIETYLKYQNDSDVFINNYQGTNNSKHEDTLGVKVLMHLNNQYSDTYKDLLTKGKIDDIPIELYQISYYNFAVPDYYTNKTCKKIAFIDTTKKDYGIVLNRFVSSSISVLLTDQDRTDLRLAYRANRSEFKNSEVVKKLNSNINSNDSLKGRKVSLDLRENDIDGWKNEMSISLSQIPLENAGFGTQNIVKTELFLEQNSDVDMLSIEEPENNLSYSNMSQLISELAKNNKQLFISTHSSYVANKLGLKHLQLVYNSTVIPFNGLDEDAYRYFLKLPGYNTLRMLLSKHIILVEGPADELIVQRAYLDNYGKLPIEDGIDVMAVGGVAFKSYCELAKLINKEITLVTDNDGDFKNAKNKYSKYNSFVKICVEDDDSLSTLEPSVANSNKADFETFKEIVYQGSDIKKRNYESIVDFMIKNKTEWSLRVFLSNTNISYPRYILEAIGK